MHHLTVGLFVVLLMWYRTFTQETIANCVQRREAEIEAEEYESWKTSSGKLGLFRAEQALSWCESYHFCRKRGSHLPTFQHLDSWVAIQGLLRQYNRIKEKQLMDGFFWIGGRKKDFGTDWTWTNENLSDFQKTLDCQSLELDKAGTGQGHVLLGSSVCKIRHVYNVLDYHFCKAGNVSQEYSRSLTWFEAQTKCARFGGRLATHNEIQEIAISGTHTFWIGLYHRPWIWIKQGKKDFSSEVQFYPVLEFPSSILLNDSTEKTARECLAVAVTSSEYWYALQCFKLLDYVLCEEDENNEVRTDAALAKTKVSIIPTSSSADEVETDTVRNDVVATSAQYDDPMNTYTWYLMVVGIPCLTLGIVIITVFGVKAAQKKRKTNTRRRSLELVCSVGSYMDVPGCSTYDAIRESAMVNINAHAADFISSVETSSLHVLSTAPGTPVMVEQPAVWVTEYLKIDDVEPAETLHIHGDAVDYISMTRCQNRNTYVNASSDNSDLPIVTCTSIKCQIRPVLATVIGLEK